MRQTDQPGIIAAVSSEFASAGINISFMTVSRVAKGTEAIMAIGVDSAPTAEVGCGWGWAGGRWAGEGSRDSAKGRPLPCCRWTGWAQVPSMPEREEAGTRPSGWQIGWQACVRLGTSACLASAAALRGWCRS